MANELKPCPFCGGADVNLYHSSKTFMSWVSCKSCGLEAPSETGITDAEAITYWNTRPVAPVDGLETVEYQVYDVYGRWQSVRKFVYDLNVDQKIDHRELVTRSQSEAIIAAGKARYSALEEIAAGLVERTDKAEADNAVLTARVKELEELLRISESCNHFADNLSKEMRTLETQLAAAKKALEPFADIADLIDTETEGMSETDELMLHFHDYEFARWQVSLFRQAHAALEVKL